MLEATWARIFRLMAQWEPPGRTSRATCKMCAQSPWIELDLLRELPEEVRHYMFTQLEAVLSSRYDQLVDEADAAAAVHDEVDGVLETQEERIQRMQCLIELAEDELWNELVRRRDDIEMLRERFIEPRMREYVEAAFQDLDVGGAP